MRTALALLLTLLSFDLAAEAPKTLTCDGVTIYSDLVVEGYVARLSLEGRSWILNRRMLLWGWGEVRRDDPKDPWLVTASAEFVWGQTIIPTIRTRRTETGALVADVDWFDSERGNILQRTVPCVFDAPQPRTLREACGQFLSSMTKRVSSRGASTSRASTGR